MSEKAAAEPIAPMSCSSCDVPMTPARVRNMRVMVQPRNGMLSRKGTELYLFVCPACGRVASRVNDVSLFSGAPKRAGG